MPRTLPASIKQDSIQPYSGGAWMYLFELVVPNQTTQRVARNTEDVTYAGVEYTKGNFDVSGQVLSGDGSIPRVTVRVAQDANRVIEQIVNDSLGAVDGTLKIIKVGENFLDDAIPALEADYDVLATESDSEWVVFTLGYPNPLTQQIPLRSYDSKTCPWATPTLFKGPECQYAGADTSCTGLYSDCRTKANQVHFGGDLGLDPNGLTL